MTLEYLDNLRQVLLELDPSGKDGFEGLIATALEKIAHVPFRLAKSGSQFGIDGKTVDGHDAISFECKRYESNPGKEKLLVKVMELSNTQNETELWIPCVTAPVPTQEFDAVKTHAAYCGIPVLLLDWSNSGLPPLAVTLAMAGDAVESFLNTSSKSDPNKLAEALKALEQLRLEEGYSEYANRLRQQISAPTAGLDLARIANGQWLESAFNNRNEARKKFGQPLAPGDSGAVKTLARKTLIDPIKQYLNDSVDERILCIHGDEGCGKSWLFAKAWMELEQKPLTIVLTADDLHSLSRGMDTLEFLIHAILEQTSDNRSESTIKRWRTRLERWKERACETSNMVVAIDGLNQKPNEDWGRILDNMNCALSKIGGKLIFTVRTQYYRNVIKRRMNYTLEEVEACLWTPEELAEILSDAGVQLSSLSESVRASLANPRLLSIALNLLDKESIQTFEELNVSRLLFEHMRQSEKDSPENLNMRAFAGQLQEHAEKILDRISAQELDDLKAFDADPVPVAESRFFRQLDNEPTKYVLREEGLALALGFSLLSKLRKAHRNDRDLGDEFQRVIEPISALDQTADVVLAALIVSCIEEDYTDDVTATLIVGFADLQNLNESDFGVFSRLVKHRPHAFMRAFRYLCLRNSRSGNFDWVKYTLRSGSIDPYLWEQMSVDIREWFFLHSLSPDLDIHHHSSKTTEELKHERGKVQAEIEKKLQALSPTEKRLLGELTQAEGNLSNLINNALHLMAGKPLASFVHPFIRWSFAVSLNSDFNIPRKEFLHLLRYNTVDWNETRDALIKDSMLLRNEEISSVGRWALIRLLRATGEPEDDEYAEMLYLELTKDRDQLKGWRLIENYCEVDPCDPGATASTNIASTAITYSEIDVSKLHANRCQSQEGLYLEMARPGMARFESMAAVSKHRELIGEVFRRTDKPLLYCANCLKEHTVLMSRDDALAIVSRLNSLSKYSIVECKEEKSTWHTVQLLLELAFPHLTAEEQVLALLHESSGEDYYTRLLRVAKPLEASLFSSLLRKAVETADVRNQIFLLGFAAGTRTQLNPESRRLTAELINSASTKVRAAAFAFIGKLDDAELLQLVASSDWQANTSDESMRYENWTGSTVLLKAVEGGYCSGESVVPRLDQSLYPASTSFLSGLALEMVAQKIEQAIHKVLGVDLNRAVPEITLNAPQGDPLAPYTYTLSERAQSSDDPFTELKQQLEARDDEDHHKKLCDSFHAFSAELSQQDAHIILDHFDLVGIRNICSAVPGFSDRLLDLYTDLTPEKLPIVGNLIVFIASGISQSEPQKAAQLFRLANTCTPFVRDAYTSSKIPLLIWALWHGNNHDDLNKVRFDRLDVAMDNQEIFLEVLAALLNGKEEILKSYIESRLEDERPYLIARALMVAGFCDCCSWCDEILERHKNVTGIIGEAHKAAIYAYERNAWSRHWYELMCGAETAEEYWRYSILFLKIVDGRFELWEDSFKRKSLITSFEPTLRASQKQRIKKWADHRKKKLFNDDVPNEVFVRGWADHRIESLS
jgi:hypothetical protein